jgi:hypothetical protein
MIRIAATLAVLAIVTLVAIRIVAGVAGGILGLVLAFAWLAFKVLLAAGLIYFVLTIVAPDTARKMRDRFSGPTV